MKKFGIIAGIFLCATILAASHETSYAGIVTEDETVVADVIDNREYQDLVIAQVTSYVNVRDLPDEKDGKILGKLYNNSVGHFIEEENGWYKIKSGSVTGYVKGEYCVKGLDALRIAKDVETTYATITCGVLRVREKATTESAILGTFSRGDDLVVKEIVDGFVKVNYNNKVGYISKDYVELHTEFVEAESIEEEKARLEKERQERLKAQRAAEAALAAEKARQEAAAKKEADAQNAIDPDSDDIGQQVVNYALQFVGNPYVYGGTSLTDGCDCSGFTQSIFKYFGVSIARTASAQRSYGSAVASLSEARPGDMIFYSGHVGIYIGNNQIVHAATPSQGIVIGNASYTTIVAIRRIF